MHIRNIYNITEATENAITEATHLNYIKCTKDITDIYAEMLIGDPDNECTSG